MEIREISSYLYQNPTHVEKIIWYFPSILDVYLLNKKKTFQTRSQIQSKKLFFSLGNRKTSRTRQTVCDPYQCYLKIQFNVEILYNLSENHLLKINTKIGFRLYL